jgi:hypothetical protein
MKRRTTWMLSILAALAVSVTPALAAKGGNGPKDPPPASAAWIGASPNPATVGSRINLSGCGYALAPVSVAVAMPDGSTRSFAVGMWSSGCLDTAYFTATEAGLYTIDVFQGSSRPLASTSVTAA